MISSSRSACRLVLSVVWISFVLLSHPSYGISRNQSDRITNQASDRITNKTVETQRPWDQVIGDLLSVFDSFLSSLQLPFVIEKRYWDASVVGGAINDGTQYLVTLHGGLLNHPKMNQDVLRITVCHEMGHHFGGAPRRNAPMEWDGPVDHRGKLLSSSEGQADYYATATCFRKLVRGENHDAVIKQLAVEPKLKQACEEVWGPSSEDSKICIRGAIAGFQLLVLNVDANISFATPSAEKATHLVRDVFPSRQCRLDTYLAGALCRSELPLEFPGVEPIRTVCANEEGQRPACWFPEEEGLMLSDILTHGSASL